MRSAAMYLLDDFVSECNITSRNNQQVENKNKISQEGEEGFLHIYQLDSQILHAKTMVVDNRLCTIGSMNNDLQSWLYILEVNVTMESSLLAEGMLKQFQRDIGNSREITKNKNNNKLIRSLSRGFSWIWYSCLHMVAKHTRMYDQLKHININKNPPD
jgi:phosphatidylserine/phosphatidylglycerophosphate/cardiolipin synthase-like enzyme